MLPRDERVQLSVTGKGGKVRQVLLPEIVSRSLLSPVWSLRCLRRGRLRPLPVDRAVAAGRRSKWPTPNPVTHD